MMAAALPSRPSRPPGPSGTAFFATAAALGRDPLAFLEDAARRYGDVVRIPLAHRTFVLVTHPVGIRHVLADNARAYDKKTPTLAKLRSVLGGGLLTSDGADWLHRRRIAQPAFHDRAVAALAPIVVGATRAMLSRWLRYPAGEPLDLGREMACLAIEIAIEALLGSGLGADGEALAEAAGELIRHTNTRIESWVDTPAILPTPGNLRFRRARAVLDGVVERLLDTPPAREAVLLRRLRLACANGEGEAGRGALSDEIMTMLLAGHETTANVLTWTLDAVARHPHVGQRMTDEAKAVNGVWSPDARDVAALGYTRQVIEESMRLRPPAWLLERRAIEDDVVGGHLVPRGMTVAICPYVTHRRPDIWHWTGDPHPELFAPERFAPEQRARIPRHAYLPFGAGARQCIGGHFAMMEATLVVAMIHRAFALQPATDEPAAPVAGVTLRPGDPVLVTLRPRDSRAPDGVA